MSNVAEEKQVPQFIVLINMDSLTIKRSFPMLLL